MGKCQLTVDAARCISPVLLSTSLSMSNKKRLKWLDRRTEAFGSAEGGTRTPMPVKAQRPERCVSTSFTTSARLCGQAYITVSFAHCQEGLTGFRSLCLLDYPEATVNMLYFL